LPNPLVHENTHDRFFRYWQHWHPCPAIEGKLKKLQCVWSIEQAPLTDFIGSNNAELGIHQHWL